MDVAFVSSDPLRECVEDIVCLLFDWNAQGQFSGSAPLCFGEIWKQRRKAWGTRAVEKGMYCFGERHESWKVVRRKTRAVRESSANDWAWGQWGGNA
jgi:hypothetical protein